MGIRLLIYTFYLDLFIEKRILARCALIFDFKKINIKKTTIANVVVVFITVIIEETLRSYYLVCQNKEQYKL